MQRTVVKSRIMQPLSEKPSVGQVNGQLADLDKIHQLRCISYLIGPTVTSSAMRAGQGRK